MKNKVDSTAEFKGKTMKELLRSLQRRSLVLGALLAVGTLALIAPRLAETSSPVELGVSQPPLVTIIFDTSASMQWGGEDEGYPYKSWSDLSGANYSSQRHRNTWVPSQTTLNLPGSAYRQYNPDTLRDEWQIRSSDHREVYSVGPCMVWNPSNSDGNHACSAYQRPPSCADRNDCDFDDHFVGDALLSRHDLMRTNTSFRLTTQTGIPRHIQVKEILTGSLHLRDPGDSSSRPGPGCWFVPRARGSMSNEQICCDSVNTISGHCSGAGNAAFSSFLDSNDPVPHYQEVWDYQVQNGLLDAMASTAIFSVVMFDSFRHGGLGDGWTFPTTDINAGSSPYSPADFIGDSGAAGVEGAAGACNGLDCYNMGFFRFIGPTTLDVSEDELGAISGYVQEAILNAGFIFHEEINLDRTRETEDGTTIEAPVFSYPLGKQPIGQGTPFAAVFHDLHQLYLNGQYHSRADYAGQNSAHTNPFSDDPYLACRGRHVVLFTDGDEILDLEGLGEENLGPEFGYLRHQYPYLPVRIAIRRMLEAAETQMGGSVTPRFQPRLHVLAVATEEEIEDPDLWAQMRAKVGMMAQEGKTCAQYYLPRHMLPPTMETRDTVDPENPVMGTCADGEICLVPQNIAPFVYNPPDGSDPFLCEHPALMLTRNDRATLIQAFQLIFNEIAGASGIAARTRPSVTNYLDNNDILGQYRIFSGLEVSGENVYWRGLLDRQFLNCNQEEDDLWRPFHEEMLLLRGETLEAEYEDLSSETTSRDRRRIFTSLPRFLLGEPMNNNSSASEELLPLTYRLAEVPTAEEFGNYQVSENVTQTEQNTRLRFEYAELLASFGGDEEALFDYFNVGEPGDIGMSRKAYLERVIDRYRARLSSRSDRVLGGIFNSNPITVGPPDQDLPIDSYRMFRRDYAERPTMTYVSTVDGLLHAIYAGDPTVMQRDPEAMTDTSSGPAARQREAWAYMPQLLHSELVDKWEGAHQLMDGSPVVRDIRLCHAQPNRNANQRVCPTFEGGVPPQAQWRTVLVQGLGTAPGYFALDVTRSGDSGTVPDPMVLWEFGREWEEMLIREMDANLYMAEADEEALSNDCEPWEFEICLPGVGGILLCDDETVDVWDFSFMGVSTAEPAVGTANVKLNDTNTVQRTVAVFGGGSPGNVQARNPACTNDVVGRAIYVVDMQSGGIIRRFIGHGGGSDATLFPAPITGTPVMSANNASGVSSRAFIGDAEGRLYRIDMSNPDPAAWKVELFFDPASPQPANFLSSLDEGKTFGPASFRPAVAVNQARNLVIVYGLGTRSDAGHTGTVQAIIALEEDRNSEDGNFASAKALWRHEFDESLNERLTGPPIIFDSDVFFTTYTEPADRCESGHARIYRARYDGIGPDFDPEEPTYEPVPRWNANDFAGGAFATGESSGDDDMVLWFGPVAPTMIRGVAITLGPVCEDVAADDDGLLQNQPRRPPQLIAQAGSADVAQEGGGGPGVPGGTAGTDISRIEIDLQRPRSRAVPMSWTVLGN